MALKLPVLDCAGSLKSIQKESFYAIMLASKRVEEGGTMASVISYRPVLGKEKLERLVKGKLHYKNLNQFIDHAVNKTLHEEMNENPVAKKIALEVEKAIYKYMPLKFVKPTLKEAKEIETAIKRTDKSGKWTSAEELLKKHKI
jgi:hypothetical protein